MYFHAIDQIIGVSVSIWMGKIDWRVLKEVGVGFGYIRAGGGGAYTDAHFRTNALQADEAQIPYGFSYYYLPYRDPKEQGKHFHNLVASNPTDAALPPVLHIEIPYTGHTCSEFAERAHLCIAEITERFGQPPVIYTRAAFWDRHLAGTSWANDYDLWIAHGTNDPEPQLPRDWSRWLMWHQGNYLIVPGIQHRVTLSLFNGTDAQFQHYIQSRTRSC
jgi:lysozyme